MNRGEFFGVRVEQIHAVGVVNTAVVEEKDRVRRPCPLFEILQIFRLERRIPLKHVLATRLPDVLGDAVDKRVVLDTLRDPKIDGVA